MFVSSNDHVCHYANLHGGGKGRGLVIEAILSSAGFPSFLHPPCLPPFYYQLPITSLWTYSAERLPFYSCPSWRAPHPSRKVVRILKGGFQLRVATSAALNTPPPCAAQFCVNNSKKPADEHPYSLTIHKPHKRRWESRVVKGGGEKTKQTSIRYIRFSLSKRWTVGIGISPSKSKPGQHAPMALGYSLDVEGRRA